jgi:hypothetical protein
MLCVARRSAPSCRTASSRPVLGLERNSITTSSDSPGAEREPCATRGGLELEDGFYWGRSRGVGSRRRERGARPLCCDTPRTRAPIIHTHAHPYSPFHRSGVKPGSSIRCTTHEIIESYPDSPSPAIYSGGGCRPRRGERATPPARPTTASSRPPRHPRDT